MERLLLDAGEVALALRIGRSKGRTRLLGRCADMGRADARLELDKILAPLNCRAIAQHSAYATLRRFVEDEYLIVKTRIWKASTRSTADQIIETHILSKLGVRSLSSLTRRDLQLHLDQKASAGLSSSVVAHIRWQLVAIFQMAQGQSLLIQQRGSRHPDARC